MKHIGYCISCYDDAGPICSLPIGASTAELRKVLRKQWPIDAEPLTLQEFVIVCSFMTGQADLVWREGYHYYVEGMNLPHDWE